MSKFRFAVTGLVCAMLGVAALTGCNGTKAGVAASVDDRVISVSQLSDVTKQVRAVEGQEVDPRQVLNIMILGPYFVALADSVNSGIPAGEVQTLLNKQLGTRKLTGDARPTISNDTVQWYRAVISSQKLSMITPQQQQELLMKLERTVTTAKISVNPRYGSFDPKTGQLIPAKLNWTVSPSSAANPQQLDPNAPQDPNQMPPDPNAPPQQDPNLPPEQQADPNQAPQDPNQMPQQADPEQQVPQQADPAQQAPPAQADPGAAQPQPSAPAAPAASASR